MELPCIQKILQESTTGNLHLRPYREPFLVKVLSLCHCLRGRLPGRYLRWIDYLKLSCAATGQRAIIRGSEVRSWGLECGRISTLALADFEEGFHFTLAHS